MRKTFHLQKENYRVDRISLGSSDRCMYIYHSPRRPQSLEHVRVQSEVGTPNNGHVGFACPQTLDPLMCGHHPGGAGGFYRHARAAEIEEVRDAVAHHGHASTCGHEPWQVIGVAQQCISVVMYKDTGEYGGVGARYLCKGNTGYTTMEVQLVHIHVKDRRVLMPSYRFPRLHRQILTVADIEDPRTNE